MRPKGLGWLKTTNMVVGGHHLQIRLPFPLDNCSLTAQNKRVTSFHAQLLWHGNCCIELHHWLIFGFNCVGAVQGEASYEIQTHQ